MVKSLWDSMSSDPAEPDRASHLAKPDVDEGFVASPTESEATTGSATATVSSRGGFLCATSDAPKGTPVRRNSVRMEDILGSAGRASSIAPVPTTAPLPDPIKKSDAAVAAGRKRTYSRTLSISHPAGHIVGLQRSASAGSLSEAAARVFASLPSSPPVPVSVHDGQRSSPIHAPAPSGRPVGRALSSAGQSFQAMLALPRPPLFRSHSFQDRTDTLRPMAVAAVQNSVRRPALGTPTFAPGHTAAVVNAKPNGNVSASKKARKTGGAARHHPNFAVFSDSSSDIEEEPDLSFATSVSANSSISAGRADLSAFAESRSASPEVRGGVATAAFARKDTLASDIRAQRSMEQIRAAVTITTARNALAPLRTGHGVTRQAQPQKKHGFSEMEERDAAAVLAGLVGFGGSA